MSILILGKGLAAGALVASAALAGVHQASVSNSSTDRPVVCHQLRKLAPPSLKAELKELRSLPKDQRPAARQAIAKKARQGAYGDQVERLMDQRRDRARDRFRELPQQLRQDLRATRTLPVDQRSAARQQIRKDVLAGKYGATVEAQLKARIARREAHRATCKARHQANQGSSTPSPSAPTPSPADATES